MRYRLAASAVLLVIGLLALSGCTTTPPTPTVTVANPTTGLPPGPSPAQIALAINGLHSTDSHPVPAMVVAGDGTLVVAYDVRRDTDRDLPNVIDIVERRSTDNGDTWSTQTVIVAHGGGDTPATARGADDPSLLFDHTTGRLFLFYDSCPARVSVFSSSTSISPASATTVHPMLRYSDNNGITWSAPVDLIEQLKRPDMTGIFASSGHGIQLQDGTLVQPYSYFVDGIERAAIAYSSDQGHSWQLSGQIGTHLSENKVAQLSDGTLLDDARPTAPGYRRFSHANCVSCAWSTPVPVTAIPDPVVNGDLIRVSQHPTWLLESNPASQTSRVRLTIRLSIDDGVTWPYAYQVTTGAAGYSVLTELPNGNYAVVYATPQALMFARFTLNQLLNSGGSMSYLAGGHPGS